MLHTHSHAYTRIECEKHRPKRKALEQRYIYISVMTLTEVHVYWMLSPKRTITNKTFAMSQYKTLSNILYIYTKSFIGFMCTMFKKRTMRIHSWQSKAVKMIVWNVKIIWWKHIHNSAAYYLHVSSRRLLLWVESTGFHLSWTNNLFR